MTGLRCAASQPSTSGPRMSPPLVLGTPTFSAPRRTSSAATPTVGSSTPSFAWVITEAELGIIDQRFAPPNAAAGPGGAVMHWHVDDLPATVERLLSLGATEYQPITKRGEGFVTASVVDPFGNVLGVMYNQHYLAVAGG